MSTEIIQDPPHLPPLPRSASHPKPKGILKNAVPPPGSAQQSLRWDEANIQSTEFPEGTFTKITEPKTPYVRYNAETDEIEGDIPSLDLNGRYINVSSSPTISASPTGADFSGPSSRRTSFSSAGRGGSGRSGSAQSSRSTSFNLPDEARSDIRAAGNGETGEEVEIGEEMDEETATKHAEFVRARGRHYSNEAEAMKRAARLMAEEDVEEIRDNVDHDDEDSLEVATRKVNINGVH